MNTNSPNWVNYLTCVLVIVGLVGGLIVVNGVRNDVVTAIEGVDIPTAAEVAALITIPDIPVVDTTMVDRICELTDGCEFWDIDDDHDGSLNEVTALTELNKARARQDFKDEFADLIGLDRDEFNFVNAGTPFGSNYFEDETQIRAYSDNDADDDNWEVKTLLRVVYHDKDEDAGDDEVVYVVVTSVLDEGEYDELSVEEVSRNFEF